MDKLQQALLPRPVRGESNKSEVEQLRLTGTLLGAEIEQATVWVKQQHQARACAPTRCCLRVLELTIRSRPQHSS